MSETVIQGSAVRREWVPRLGPLGAEVDRRISRLQDALGRSSAATAMLAHLRASVAMGPGSVPAIWELTISDLPGQVRGDDPTPQERAAHAAMTLYAVHQQSRSVPMHRRGPGFGQAVRRLAGDDPETAVRRRFDAAATATSFEELVHHLRGVISQLRTRGEGIPLDYGQLADDLLRLQYPGGAEVVRRRWGRQFYWLDKEDANSQAASESTPTSTQEEK